MIKYVDYEDRVEWLANRRKSLGASEIAIACGITHFKSKEELWEEKVGIKRPADLSDNERVRYGTQAEKYLRGLFELKHANDYKVEYLPYRVYRNEETPYLTCTLDGRLISLVNDGEIGGYECKTVLINSKKAFDEWDGKIPDGYYCQVCQQMYSAGLDFVIVNVELRNEDNSAEIREYMIKREEVENDIKYVVKKGKEFWQYVLTKKRPPIELKL